MSRTIDRRRPLFLTLEQEEEAQNNPMVQELFTKKTNLKRSLKSEGRTIKSYEGTAAFEEYNQLKRAYESELEFQRKTLLKDMRQRFDREQAIRDLQAQFNGEQVKEEDNDEDGEAPTLLPPERLAVLDALFTIHYPTPENERARRVAAIEAMMDLGKLQNGHQYPVRHRRNEALKVKPEPTSQQEVGVCKPRQCFFCVARRNYHEFHSRGDLKKHILRSHVNRHKADEAITCPLDGHVLDGGWQHVLAHAHSVHGTPLCK
jgi:hypothetical protein